MAMLLQHERLCTHRELEILLTYLDAERDQLAERIRRGEFSVLVGNVYSISQVAGLNHSWPTVPGPVQNVPKGTPYIEVGRFRALFEANPNAEWAEHKARIDSMVDTLRNGRELPGKIVMWRQHCPLDAWVIIIGNHTASALYNYALKSTQELNLFLYRVEEPR